MSIAEDDQVAPRESWVVAVTVVGAPVGNPVIVTDTGASNSAVDGVATIRADELLPEPVPLHEVADTTASTAAATAAVGRMI